MSSSTTAFTPPAVPPVRDLSPGGGTPVRQEPARPRLHVLDGLRLLAALSVVLWHYTGYQQHPAMWGAPPAKVVPHLHTFGAYGWIGVELFFLISGFVICMSAWGRTAGKFFVSRVVRLFPAYWICLLITSAVVLGKHPSWMWNAEKFRYSDVLTNMTMIQNGIGGLDIDPVYWTLWIEMRFYVLFGVLVAIGLTYRRVVMFCGIWMFGAIAAGVSGMPLLDLIFVPEYAPLFIAGLALFLMYRFGPDLLLWGIVAFCWLVSQHKLLQIMSGYQNDAHHRLSYSFCLLLLTLCFAVMLATALGWLNWVRGRWLVTAGALTYPVYLLHEEIGWWVLSELHGRINPYLLTGLVIAGVMVLAYLVHRLVERPLSKVLKRGLDQALERGRKIDALVDHNGRRRHATHSAAE
ncbi:acyltransferase [Kitasatospora paranensis]|uniref:Acyltransferase family protein n=1 Tax=Kitasatospora paranensis TaxID=258053 RepID=A0ABW2FY55_9ACTN